jgi:signal peptidase II
VTGESVASSASDAPGSGVAPSRGGIAFGTLLGLVVTASLVVLDQASKSLVLAGLTPGRTVVLFTTPRLGGSLPGIPVGLQLVFNPGGAWGLPAPHWVFLVVTVVVVAVVLRSLPQVPTVLQAVSYGMLLAGALGNAIDRVLRAGDSTIAFGGGYVVDWVAWGTFPRFNVADASISVGFVLLVIALLRDDRVAAADDGRSR